MHFLGDPVRLAAGFSRRFAELREPEVEMMSADEIHLGDFVLPVFPAESDTRWETEYRMVWNKREHTSEERELV